MTRGEIIGKAKGRLVERPGTPGAALLSSWDDIIDQVADDLARLDCLFLTERYDIVAGQRTYPLPKFYRTVELLAIQPNAYPERLISRTPTDMIGCDSWGDWSYIGGGYPRYAVYNGVSSVTLWPVPQTSVQGGLIAKGYAVPSSGAPGGCNMWPGQNDECPLPPQTHIAVVIGAAYQRCIQFPTPDNRARAAMLKEEYTEQKGNFFKELQESNPAVRHAGGGW